MNVQSIYFGVMAVRSAPTMADVVAGVCAAYGVTLSEIRGARGNRLVCAARAEAYYLCRQLKTSDGAPYSYSRIGLFFRRDHSSVVHGVQTHTTRLAAQARAA